MEDLSLTSLSITHVYYNPTDSISFVSAYLALVPQALTVIYVAVLWSTREIEILLMFAGQMGTFWMSESSPSFEECCISIADLFYFTSKVAKH